MSPDAGDRSSQAVAFAAIALALADARRLELDGFLILADALAAVVALAAATLVFVDLLLLASVAAKQIRRRGEIRTRMACLLRGRLGRGRRGGGPLGGP